MQIFNSQKLNLKKMQLFLIKQACRRGEQWPQHNASSQLPAFPAPTTCKRQVHRIEDVSQSSL